MMNEKKTSINNALKKLSSMKDSLLSPEVLSI